MNLIERSQARTGMSDATVNTLVTILKGDDRHYHGLGHISYMLTLFERHGLSWLNCEQALITELAIWFHDIVYDSKATDNEERSAKMATDVLALPTSAADMLVEQIMATKGHTSQDDVTQFLIDLDLAILGAGDSRYNAYARGVRAEYAWVADDAYATGREQVLRSFLLRDELCPILSSRAYGDRHTIRDAARFNMDREIKRLREHAA